MKLTKFTRKIWGVAASGSDKRANYLLWVYLRAATMKPRGKYLDIGCGVGQNAIIFGENCQSIHCLDIDTKSLASCRANFQAKGVGKASFYQANAQALPFKDATFDKISMFSLIEHVTEQRRTVEEAARVIKDGGVLILQVPNKYFFVDLHTGLPLLHCLPSLFRQWLLTKLGYKGISDIMSIRVPSKSELTSLIRTEFAEVRILKIVYPPDLIMPQLKPVYFALKALGVFSLVPFGFLFIADKEEHKYVP
jgi:ubiquinone/menaquinone biosynthesis C-methylase UbiE